MSLIESFVRNPVKVTVGVLLISLFGVLSMLAMPMQLIPDVQTPTLTIETIWPGASPQEVERVIVQEQEKQLKSVGITVRHDLPGVGGNLQDHLDLFVISECTGDHTYDGVAKLHRTLWAGLQYVLFRSGPVASSLFETGGFWYADPTAAQPDIQFHLGLGSGIEAGVEKLKNPGVTLNSAFLRPRSRGSVRLSSSDPAAAPLIDGPVQDGKPVGDDPQDRFQPLTQADLGAGRLRERLDGAQDGLGHGDRLAVEVGQRVVLLAPEQRFFPQAAQLKQEVAALLEEARGPRGQLRRQHHAVPAGLLGPVTLTPLK